MESVKRWRVDKEYIADDGDFVSLSDYQAKEKECKDLKQRIQYLEGFLPTSADFEFQEKKNHNLEKERDRLSDELKRIRSVGERLLNSDNENELSLKEYIAGEYIIKILDGENFQ